MDNCQKKNWPIASCLSRSLNRHGSIGNLPFSR